MGSVVFPEKLTEEPASKMAGKNALIHDTFTKVPPSPYLPQPAD
jgi:hypothetical protein